MLGEGYEVVEGEGVSASDMVNIFSGATLFETKRRILLKDLSESREAWDLRAPCPRGPSVATVPRIGQVR